MIDRVKKGQRTEKRCADELKKLGYLIWKTIRTKYGSIDLFGLFDVVALHPQGEHILFIQCKTNRADNKMRDAIRSLRMPPGCRKEMWIWVDKKGWRKEYYD